jgi:hypothetical protein
MAEMKTKLRAVRGLIEGLERKYDAEYDYVPGQPAVYYSDMELARALKYIVEVSDEQEQRLDEISQKLDRLERERQVYD